MLGEVLPAGGGIVHRVELAVAFAVKLRRLLLAERAVGDKFFVLEKFADLGETLEIISPVGAVFYNQGSLVLRELAMLILRDIFRIFGLRLAIFFALPELEDRVI